MIGGMDEHGLTQPQPGRRTGNFGHRARHQRGTIRGRV